MSREQTSPDVAIYLRMIYDCGVDRVMLNLCQGLVQRQLKVDLVLNTVAGYGNLLSEFPPEVRVVDLKAHHQSRSLPDVIQYLRRERPRAMLAAGHYSTEIAIIAKHLTQVPTRIIVAEHTAISQDAQSAAWRESKRWIPTAARLTYPWADGIVAVSKGVAEDLARSTGLPLERIQVIYNPAFTPNILERAKEPIHHPWFSPGEPPVILGIGRLEPQKDFTNLIRAFAQIHKVRPARLMILGRGREETKLKNLVHELKLENDVALPGFVENPYAYMSRCAVFALSSAWEGLPTVLIEALALGVPVVSTNCESGPDELLDHGKYGPLVPVGDSELLAQGILQVLEVNHQPINSEWLNQFTVESATKEYLKILDIAGVSRSIDPT